MPFKYDQARISNPKNNVIVHEELSTPKPSPLSSKGGYQGFANGKDVTNVLMVDGNNKTKDVVYYMMTKPNVQKVVDEKIKSVGDKTNGLMTFSLIPSNNGSKSMGGSSMNMSSMSNMSMNISK